MELNMELLRQLVEIVREAQISELTVRVGDWRVTIRKGLTASPTEATFSPTEEVTADETVEVTQAGEGTAETKSAAPTYLPILSNWVGIVRRQQDGKLLVQVGDIVRRGQTVCWIDALGVRNEVRAPEAGRIVEIFVEDGQPVEFGQQLMLLEPMTEGD
ncbi:MAG: hypothetical protein SLRJCFUN_001218 [Candidatus Fervidibacter sp.]|jgi:biotin carboxyl carrier protein